MTQKEKYIAAQKAWLEMTGLKVGDKVKVNRKAKDYEFGWNNGWWTEMDNMVGEETTIKEVGDSFGLCLKKTAYYSSGSGIAYYYPFFVLEPIQEEPSLSGSVVEVKVNGKTYKATIH
jgi:hypothetical protein